MDAEVVDHFEARTSGSRGCTHISLLPLQLAHHAEEHTVLVCAPRPVWCIGDFVPKINRLTEGRWMTLLGQKNRILYKILYVIVSYYLRVLSYVILSFLVTVCKMRVSTESVRVTGVSGSSLSRTKAT